MPMGGNKIADPSSSTTRKGRRRQKKPDSSTSVIQTIYDISKDVFAEAMPGFMPPAPSAANLSQFLNGLMLQDVGLDAAMPYLRADPDGRPRVTYLHFADSPWFSFGVFCLPQSAVIPLHDHPGMTVFSKILLGSMHIKSYDWVKAPDGGHHIRRMSDGARWAKLNTDAVFDASSETVVLYPEEGGNLHCFTAVTPCAVLDVMGPPYCRAQGRDCSYYSGVAAPGGDGQYAWLKEAACTFEMNTLLVQPRIRE